MKKVTITLPDKTEAWYYVEEDLKYKEFMRELERQYFARLFGIPSKFKPK